MIFNYNFTLKFSEIDKILLLNQYNILDYGCGQGIWSVKDIEGVTKIKKINLYDRNPGYLKILNTKYINEKFNILKNIKNLKNIEYNTVILSSVIQYMNNKEFEALIESLSERKEKITFIIIDIPYLSRIVEFLLLPIFNLKRFFFSFKFLISKDYKKLNFNLYQKKYFINKFDKTFDLKFLKNLHDLKFLRYSLVLTKKN